MLGLSLRTKVFFLFAGAALLTVVPALVLVADAVEERVYERATQELKSAGEAMGYYWSLQDGLLQLNALRAVAEPGVAALVRQRDTVKLHRLLTRRFTEPQQVVLATDSAGTPLLGPPLDSATLNRGGSVVVVPPGGGPPIRVAVAPVFAESTTVAGVDSLAEERIDSVQVGVVGMGARLDQRTLAELKVSTNGADVALVVGDSLLATTLPDTLARVLRRYVPNLMRNGGIWRGLENLPYLLSVNRLPTHGPQSAVLLFRPVAEELRVARGITRSMVVIGFSALVVALLLALLVARIVARPAQALAGAAADLARGDYGAPLPKPSGDEIGQLTRAFADMRSAIAEREARLRSAQAEMIHREKLAAMGRLVAQLSHEINNPIYNIQNCLEALDRRGDPRDPNREFLVLAREELERMAVLTRQLLDQSRPLSDAATSLDLNQLVQRVVTLATPDLRDSDIRPELHLQPDLPLVVAHPDAMQQVLANLVANAIDAMPGGGTLRLATSAHGEMVEIAVQDTGTGIADEHLPHIFEAFYTTKPGVRGIGLGLFVSEGIVRGHRGRLSVESRPGEGSRFVIRLPRETLDATLSGSDAPESAASATA